MILVGERTNMLILQQQKNKKINRHFLCTCGMMVSLDLRS